MAASRGLSNKPPNAEDGSRVAGASAHVVSGIMRALEQQQMVPGQRLVETELAIRFAVGRNAVREAIQQLAERGIVEVVRNRSPSIRTLEIEEAKDVLEVAEIMTGLLARAAARNFRRERHLDSLTAVTKALERCQLQPDADAFNKARRRFYGVLLDISANHELRRLFSTIRMEIIYAQYRSTKLQEIRFADYRIICAAVKRGDIKGAETAGKRHVRRVRGVIEESETDRSMN